MTDLSITMVERMIKSHEGLRLEAYKDSLGKKTIGWGHLWKPGDKDVITRVEAEDIFRDDMLTAVHGAYGFGFFHGLSGNRQAVMIDMVYNLGRSRFAKFHRLIGFLEEGLFVEAGLSMVNSTWFVQVKGRSLTLVKMMVLDMSFDDSLMLEV